MRDEHFALELMNTGIEFLRSAKMRSDSYDPCPFRYLICYCIKQVKPGLWLPLNRDYNVLGLSKGEWSDYNSSLYEHLLIKTEDINFDVLWDNDSNLPSSNNFYLFTDSTHPNIYYKKTTLSQNLYLRYIAVVASAFFDDQMIGFEKAWKYKDKNGSKDFYNQNLKRIKGL